MIDIPKRISKATGSAPKSEQTYNQNSNLPESAKILLLLGPYAASVSSPRVTSDTNVFTERDEINMWIEMGPAFRYGKLAAIAFLLLTIWLAANGTFVSALNPPYDPPYPFPPTFPVNNFDFTITASATLIKIQPGQTGGLVIWVDLYCPNSTVTIRCDSTVLQEVNLQFSGCPSGAFCILDKQQVLLPPLYQAGSNFLVYTFLKGGTGVTPITVTGMDQFGRIRSVTFGVVVCNC